MAIGIDVIAVIIFFAIVGILLLIDRKNIEFNYGLIIRRWKRGQYVMDKWIFAHKKFLSIVGTIGVVVGFIASIGGLGAIIYMSTLNQQAVSPVLPTVGGFEYPTGVIGVPFWFWIVSIFVILTVHEPMHAIFARLVGVPVRSWGVMTLLVLPLGAFVDPDMKKVQKLKLSQKLRIFAGGSFGNFVTGAIVGVILFSMGAVFFSQTFSTVPGTPADKAGLQGNILSVNGVDIKKIDDLTNFLNKTPVGTKVDVVTDKGEYFLNTVSRSNSTTGSSIGVQFRSGIKLEYLDWGNYIITAYQLFFWLFIFNVGVGIFNMLPMKPFDGGHMFEAVFAKIFKSDKLARTAVRITSIIVLGIILFNVFGTNLIKLAIG